MMKVLAVTGGIGSGKSAVCRLLHDKWKFPVYEADSRVKALYASHPSLLSDIEKALGCRLRDENGNFVPALLAGKIFDGPDALEKVEELVFPVLKEDFRRFAGETAGETAGKTGGKTGGQTVVFESATILEKPQFEGFADKVLLVYAPFELRLRRACRRDGAGRDAVLARMGRQKLMNELGACCDDPRIDAVVVNDGTEEELEHKVDAVIAALFTDEIKMT